MSKSKRVKKPNQSKQNRCQQKQTLQEMFKRYGVAVRSTDSKVKHNTYPFTTVLTPEQFALFETAAKALYIHWMVEFAERHDYRSFLGCQLYHQQIFDENGFDTPWIEESWKIDKSEEAAADYSFCAGRLRLMTGKDAETGEERNLYFATLD